VKESGRIIPSLSPVSGDNVKIMSLTGRRILNLHHHRRSASRIVDFMSDQVERCKKQDHHRWGLTLCSTLLHHHSTGSSSPSKSFENNKQSVVVAMPLEDTHYQAHDAESYESAFFYARGDYTSRLRDLVVTQLGLDVDYDSEGVVGVAAAVGVFDNYTPDGSPRTSARGKRRFLDVGGGTGNFTRMLLEDRSHLQAVVIDPFLAKVEAEREDEHLRFVQAPAEAFLNDQQTVNEWWKRDYHQVLFKEVVHHLPEEKRCDIFRSIHQGLLDIPPNNNAVVNSTTTTTTMTPPPPPSLLIITRPQREIDYPLWDAARCVWAENQPSSQQLAKELREAGFSQVENNIHIYPCILPSLQKWQDMVRNRCWSTFSHFTDDELEQACQDLAVTEQHRIDEQGRLHFEDRLVFIAAWK
jgi:SAM-dependent methyltransferase